MSTSPSAIPKVRTYAADLNSMRAAKNIPVGSTAPTPTPAPEPVIVEKEASQTIPPFHTFSKNETVVTAPSAPQTSQAKPVAVSSSQLETQKILTASSNLQATGTLKEDLPAVIITDTKHKRFKLSSAIGESLQNWWNNKKQSAQQKKIPKYTVPVAERRKGVIQKATAKTGRESSADHTAVLTRIKATKQIPHTTDVAAPVMVPPKTVTPLWESAEPTTVAPLASGIQNQRVVKRQSTARETVVPPLTMETLSTHSWESDIQAKANAIAEPKPVQNSSIILTGKEFTKIKEARAQTPATETTATPVVKTNRVISPMIPPQMEKPAASSTPVFVNPTPVVRPQIPVPPIVTTPPKVVVPTIPTAPVPAVPKAVEPVPYTRPKIEPIIPTAPQSAAAAVSVETVTPVQATGAVATPTPEPKREERRFAPPRETKRDIWSVFAQTNRMVFITLGILIFVVVSGLGLRAYRTAPSPVASNVSPIVETALTDSTAVSETIFYNDKNQLSERLKSQSSDADSLVEISFISSMGAPLNAPDFLTLFDASVPFDFVASINDIRLGNYRGAPWILLTISDKNTALGGMLAWETTMGRNLAPIFSTEEATSYARFTDSIINNVDVRIMKNNNGTEEIVYGFVGYDTLLITSNTTAFLNLAQKIY